jgi:hypothetical protein
MTEVNRTRILIDADTLLSGLENNEFFELDEFIFSPQIDPCITQRGLASICNHFLVKNSINGEAYCTFLGRIKSLFTICEFNENWFPDLKPLTVGINDLTIALDVLTAYKYHAVAIITNQPAKFNHGRNIPVISIASLRVSYRFRNTLIELKNMLFQCAFIELTLNKTTITSFTDDSGIPVMPRLKKPVSKSSKNKIGIDFSHPAKSHARQWWTIASSRSNFMRRISGPRSLEENGRIANPIAKQSIGSFHLETAYEPGRSMRDYWRRFEY